MVRYGQFSGTVGLAVPESRATIENPSVSLQDPEAWDQMFGTGFRADSGESVTPERSLSIAAVWQCVSMISADVAGLPLDVFKRTDDGREVDKNHPAQVLCRRKWNPQCHAFKGWRTLLVHALIWGNGYAFIDRNGAGQARGLYPLLPDRTTIERVNGQLYYVTEVSPNQSGPARLEPISYGDVFHITGISCSGTAGEALVQRAKQAWGLSLAQQGFASKFFAKGGRMGGTLEIPLTASQQFADGLQEGFRKQYEDRDSWFKTVILRDGAKFHQGSHSPQESQLNEQRESQVREVARYYNMQPSRLGLSDSVSYNSKSEDNQSYLDTTLKPWLHEITCEGWMKLLSQNQQQADSHYLEHNSGALLQLNPLDQAQAFSIGIRNRYLLPNEARRKLNMPPLPDGDAFPPLSPLSQFNKGENDRPRGDADSTGGEGDNADRSLEAKRLVFRLCAHARKKSLSHNAFGEFLERGAQGYPETEHVRECFAALRAAEEVPVSELASKVETICQRLEREINEH